MTDNIMQQHPMTDLPPMEEHYEWELQDASGEWVAGGSANDQGAVNQEGMRYLVNCLQDGPYFLTIRRHQVQTIMETIIP